MRSEENISEKAVYERAVEILSSSLSSNEAREEAISSLDSIDYLDSKVLAEKYKKEYEIMLSEQKTRAKSRKAGRVIQYILIGALALVGAAVMVILAILVTYAFTK